MSEQAACKQMTDIDLDAIRMKWTRSKCRIRSEWDLQKRDIDGLFAELDARDAEIKQLRAEIGDTKEDLRHEGMDRTLCR